MSNTRQIGKRKQLMSKIMLTGFASVVGNHLKQQPPKADPSKADHVKLL